MLHNIHVILIMLSRYLLVNKKVPWGKSLTASLLFLLLFPLFGICAKLIVREIFPVSRLKSSHVLRFINW